MGHVFEFIVNGKSFSRVPANIWETNFNKLFICEAISDEYHY